LYNILSSYDWICVYSNTSLPAAVSSVILTLHEAIDHSMTLGSLKRSNFPLRFSLYRKLVKTTTKFVFAVVLVVDWRIEKALTVRCYSKNSILLVKFTHAHTIKHLWLNIEHLSRRNCLWRQNTPSSSIALDGRTECLIIASRRWSMKCLIP
jgi:hypothetical protein